MCTTILIEGKTIESRGHLAKYLNLPTIPEELWYDGYDKTTGYDTNEGSCLCGIKIEELAKFIGVPYVRSALYYHLGEYEIVLASKNSTEFI